MRKAEDCCAHVVECNDIPYDRSTDYPQLHYMLPSRSFEVNLVLRCIVNKELSYLRRQKLEVSLPPCNASQTISCCRPILTYAERQIIAEQIR